MCVWWFILNYEICMKFEVSQSDTMQWSLICSSISWIYRYYAKYTIIIEESIPKLTQFKNDIKRI